MASKYLPKLNFVFFYLRSFIAFISLVNCKAYDLVSWDFLEVALLGFGSPKHFVKIVMACVSTSSFPTNINGSATGFFPGKHGLKQGDPIFPLLGSLRGGLAAEENQFKYHPKCARVKLCHLIFVVDLLLFFKGGFGFCPRTLEMF